jgi:hypothetical protein
VGDFVTYQKLGPRRLRSSPFDSVQGEHIDPLSVCPYVREVPRHRIGKPRSRLSLTHMSVVDRENENPWCLLFLVPLERHVGPEHRQSFSCSDLGIRTHSLSPFPSMWTWLFHSSECPWALRSSYRDRKIILRSKFTWGNGDFEALPCAPRYARRLWPGVLEGFRGGGHSWIEGSRNNRALNTWSTSFHP